MADEPQDLNDAPHDLPPPVDDWDEEARRRDGSIGDLASRFIRAGAEAVASTGGRIRERGEEFKPREVLAGAAKVAATGKDEVVTLIAKEVRNYLDKLEIANELADFARSHELEVNAKFRLKRILPDGDAEEVPTKGAAEE